MHNDLTIGKPLAPDRSYFSGAIDEIILYNKALIQAEAMNRFNLRDADIHAPEFRGLTDERFIGQGGEVRLRWNAAEDTSTPITYKIYHATRSGDQDFAAPPTYSTQDTSCLVTGLSENQNHYFVVRTEDAVGNEICTNELCSIINPQSSDDSTCDRVDDNCDGSFDENYPSDVTNCGKGVCAATGIMSCENGFERDSCRQLPRQASIDDNCNGVDEDCSGEADEDITRFHCDGEDDDFCSDGVKACIQNDSGVFVIGCEDSVNNPEHIEVCDGQDNNCDRNKDKDDNGLALVRECGPPEEQLTGLCIKGQHGHWRDCTAVFPTEEVCNGKDDDCDGDTDEGPDGQPLRQPCGETDDGICSMGVEVCEGGNWVNCTAVFPLDKEECNNLDDNCDRDIDENLTQSCITNNPDCPDGTQVCSNGEWGDCLAGSSDTPEFCDGRDNDCDGLTDLDDPDLSPQKNDLKVGVCENTFKVCDGTNGWENNYPSEYQMVEFKCDGLDNDCDGKTDEDFYNNPLTRECGPDEELLTGQCRKGIETCVNEEWVNCTAVFPTGEVCNYLDDNCDGLTDENFDVGDGCSEGSGPCIRYGIKICADINRTVCSAERVTSTTSSDLCGDGIDNDCNGFTDEDCECSPGDEQSCGTGTGECVPGTQYCINRSWGGCQNAVGPTAEICDGLDNDCDGKTDEDYNDNPLTQRCGPDEIGECRKGVKTCVGDRWSDCMNAVYPSGNDICDGDDNDCDGETDEDYDVGTACSIGSGVCKRGGIKVCASDNNRTVCDAEYVPTPDTPDICENGIDDDCDGSTDEGCVCTTGESQPCGSGVGECVPGTKDCVAGKWGECQGAVGPTAEKCDRLDNNCNGTVDEGFNVGEVCYTGYGECRREGVWLCSANKLYQICSAEDCGVVAHWRFDEGLESDAIVVDSSAYHNNDGIISGATRIADGYLNNALSFDGDDDYVDVSSVYDDMNVLTGSVELWAKPASITTSEYNFMFGHFNSGNRIYIFQVLENLTYRLGDSQDVDSGYDLTAGEWVHIVLVYDNGIATIYVNGNFVHSSPYTGLSTLSANISIGDSHPGWRYPFNGLIDEVVVYDRALDPSEILDRFNSF